MNNNTQNNENEHLEKESISQTKGLGDSSKKLFNHLSQSAQFDSMSKFMNKSAIGVFNGSNQVQNFENQSNSNSCIFDVQNSQIQKGRHDQSMTQQANPFNICGSQQYDAANKAFQERLNKSGIFFKNGTLVNITDIDIDGNQNGEKDEKIRDLEDRETILKKQLREVSAKLEKDIAILNQKLEFTEFELKEAKQKLKDNDEFFRLFEINDLRYQQHPIFKQKFAQLNEMHNQQITMKQKEIDSLRALLRQYNEPTVQSADSLNSLVFSQKKQIRNTNNNSSAQKDGIDNQNEVNEFIQDRHLTPTKLNQKKQYDQTHEGSQIKELESQQESNSFEKIKKNRNNYQSQQNQDITNFQQDYSRLIEENKQMNSKINDLENEIIRYKEINTQNEKNKQVIQDLQEQYKNSKLKLNETVEQLKSNNQNQENLLQEQLQTKMQQINEYEKKIIIMERSQSEILERVKNEQTMLLQEQMNSIIAERESGIQEYYEQEYLNKLEFYEKKHTEILEENQKNFEEQMYVKEQTLLNQVQQREQCYEDNISLKQLEFEQKIKSYELQLQTKNQDSITQEHVMTAAQQKVQEKQKQIDELQEVVEKHSIQNDSLKQLLEDQNEKSEDTKIRNQELQRECEQQHQLILKLELEIQQSTEKTQNIFKKQISDLEIMNQSNKTQIKDLEIKLQQATTKLSNELSMNKSGSSNSSNNTSESKPQKKKQKYQPGVIVSVTNPKYEIGDAKFTERIDDNGDEDQKAFITNDSSQHNLNNQTGEFLIDNSNDQSNITMFSTANISYNLDKNSQSLIQKQPKLVQQLQSQLQQQQILFTGEKQKIQAETNQLQLHIKQLEELLLENRDAYYKERTVLENSIQKLKNDCKESQLQLQQEQNKTELVDTKKQVQDITAKYNQVEEQRKILQSRIDKIVEQQTKQIQNESSNNSIVLQAKNNEINEYRIRIEVLQNQLKEQDSLVKKIQSNSSLLEIEKNELLQQVNFLENESQQAQEQIVQQYENELQSLSTQLNDQIQEFAEERQRFLDTIESLQKSINFQNSKNQELIEQCQQIEQEEGNFEQQQEFIRNLEDKMREQEHYMVERENFFSIEMKKKEKIINDLLNQIHILEMNRKQMMDEVELEQERFLAQIQRQSQAPSSSTDQLNSKQIILALQQERDYLQKKVEIIESQKDSLRNEVNEMNQKFENLQNSENQERMKDASPNRNFGFVSFKAGSNCVSFAPQPGLAGSSPSTQQYHKKGNSVYQNNNYQAQNNLPCQTSQSQIMYQGANADTSNNAINPSYDNGQYLNTSQFGGDKSNYLSNSTINFTQPANQKQSSIHGPYGNSMAQSSILSSGQSFIQNNNHIIFGSVNHSSLYGLSQAQMLEIIERAYMDRLQQQQLYFEQKIRKERDDASKRSREPALIAERKKLQFENEKLTKEVSQLRIHKQLDDEFNTIKGSQQQILSDTANLCNQKSRSKTRLTNTQYKNGDSEQESFSSLGISNYFSPNKVFTDYDVKKKPVIQATSQSQILPSSGNTHITSITSIHTTTTTKSTNLEAGSIIGTRKQNKSSNSQNQQPISLNQNIPPSSSSISSSSYYSKQSPISSSIILSTTNINPQNKGHLQNSTISANNNYTKAYGAKDSTLISINSNSDIFKSNIFNSNNTSNSVLKNSNINESYIKNTSNHNLSTQYQSHLKSPSSVLSAYPQRDSTPTTLLKKSYIKLDDIPQPSLSNSNSLSQISSRAQRSITDNKLFNPIKLNTTQQKY